jgi:hypothetical protein
LELIPKPLAGEPSGFDIELTRQSGAAVNPNFLHLR